MGEHEKRTAANRKQVGLGTDLLNAFACFCEVSDDLRYSLQKLCYSKVDLEMQRIAPIFNVFDRKSVGCIDLEDFTTTMRNLQADVTELQCGHLFDRLIKCFEEKEAGK